MRQRRSYPKHAFPCLFSTFPPSHSVQPPRGISRHQKRVLHALSQKGTTVIFDAEQRKALLVRAAQGLQSMLSMGVRTLAWLVKHGYLVLVHRQGSYAHYTYAQAF